MISTRITVLLLVSTLFVSINEAQKCSVTYAQMLNSSNKVLFWGDYSAVMPVDQKGVDGYCKMMTENLKIALQYVRCLKPFPKTVVGMGLMGYKKYTKKRCVNDKWREGFLTLGKCLSRANITKNVHTCNERGSIGYDYVYAKIPLKDQILFGCCIYSAIVKPCFREEATACGDELATFAYQMQNEPTADVSNLMCSSLDTTEKCVKRFPEYMKKIKNHLKTHKTPERSLLSASMRVMLGQDIEI